MCLRSWWRQEQRKLSFRLTSQSTLRMSFNISRDKFPLNIYSEWPKSKTLRKPNAGEKCGVRETLILRCWEMQNGTAALMKDPQFLRKLTLLPT